MDGLKMQVTVTAFTIVSAVVAQFSDSDKQDILDVHNHLRSVIALGNFTAKNQVMPAAADMRKMVWSPNLEASAQAYSTRCVFEHSHQSGVGENLYMAWSTVTNSIAGKGATASTSWASEFQKFGWSSVVFGMDVFNTGVGHATQMAWSSSYQVGCGASLCGTDSKSMIVVCQYWPQGNILQTNTYTPGSTCSQCPSGTVCESTTGLCA